MIRVATVFSGMGAIEHALQRMGLEHEIVFACDNGEVPITSNVLHPEVQNLSGYLKEIGEGVRKLEKDEGVSEGRREQLEVIKRTYERINKEYRELIESVEVSEDCIKEVVELLQEFVDKDLFNENVRRNYRKWVKDLTNDEMSLQHRQVEVMKAVAKIHTDYQRIYKGDFKDSKYFNRIDNQELREDVVKGVSERMGEFKRSIEPLYEDYIVEKSIRELERMEDFKDKVEYVQDLYKGREKRNQVYRTYEANYDIDPNHFHWNVALLDGKYYRDKVDLFVGGSPCQSFSQAGRKEGFEDTRGTLFYDYVRLVDEVRPKVFIYENVRSVFTHDKGKTWEIMSKSFNSLGYDWHYEILDAKDYGIPQSRRRMFVIGFRKDLGVEEFAFPKKKELTTVMKDYLEEVVSDVRYIGDDGEVNNPPVIKKTENVEEVYESLKKHYLTENMKKYVLSPGTKNYKMSVETDLDIARTILASVWKIQRAGIANYVTTNGKIRKLTPRESLRLMGYCDSFKIVISNSSIYKQAGNSIVVDVLIAIMESILEQYPALQENH